MVRWTDDNIYCTKKNTRDNSAAHIKIYDIKLPLDTRIRLVGVAGRMKQLSAVDDMIFLLLIYLWNPCKSICMVRTKIDVFHRKRKTQWMVDLVSRDKGHKHNRGILHSDMNVRILAHQWFNELDLRKIKAIHMQMFILAILPFLYIKYPCV